MNGVQEFLQELICWGPVTRESVATGNKRPGNIGLPDRTPAQGNQGKGPKVPAEALFWEYWSEQIRLQFCVNQAGYMLGLGLDGQDGRVSDLFTGVGPGGEGLIPDIMQS